MAVSDPMRTGTKFWLACGVSMIQLIMFFALLITDYKFDSVSIGIFVGGPAATFTAFGMLNVKASGQTPPTS
jgi:hypothetical protein